MPPKKAGSKPETNTPTSNDPPGKSASENVTNPKNTTPVTPAEPSGKPTDEKKTTIWTALIGGIALIIVAAIGYYTGTDSARVASEGKIVAERLILEQGFNMTTTAIAANAQNALPTYTPLPSLTPLLTYTPSPASTPIPTYTPYPTEIPLGESIDSTAWSVEKWTAGTSSLPLTPKYEPLIVGGEKIEALSLENVNLLSRQSSEAGKEGWNNTIEAVRFVWPDPIKTKPYNGIVAQLFIEPSPKDKEDRVFCEFFMRYNLGEGNGIYEYTSSEHYMAFGEWNSLAWDLTGIYNSPLSSWSEVVSKSAPSGHTYLSAASRLPEKILRSATLSDDPAWTKLVESIGVMCYVSASNDYVGAVSQVDFNGTLKLGKAWAIPVDFPSLP